MKTKKSVGLILIIAAVVLLGLGINKFDNSGGSVNVLGAELSVKDNTSRQSSYMYMGLAVLCFLGGIYTLKRA